MRLSLLVLVSLLAGCTQLRSQVKLQPLVHNSSVQSSLDESILAAVKKLSDEPQWLFPVSECPGDVMPVSEYEVQHSSKDCTLNPEGCLNSCAAENGSACYGLAQLFQQKQEIEDKYSEALFLRSCKLGIVSGCTNRAAGMLSVETNDSVALGCIARTFEKTCAKEDPWGCTMYGLVLSQGIGCDRDIKKALEILPKACNKFGSSDPACQHAQKLREQILQTQ